MLPKVSIPATTAAEVVEQARTWLGTPWQHQGRRKGLGVDCAGLIIGVAAELGLSPRGAPGTRFDMTGYAAIPDGIMLRQVCHETLDPGPPRRSSEPGVVLLLRMVRSPQHLAIVAGGEDKFTMIHSYANAKRSGLRRAGWCVEHVLAPVWRQRIIATYRFPGVAY